MLLIELNQSVHQSVQSSSMNVIGKSFEVKSMGKHYEHVNDCNMVKNSESLLKIVYLPEIYQDLNEQIEE
jgi:hypothetical protein